MPPRGRGEVPEVSTAFCFRLDLHPDRLPQPQPATNVEKPRASARDCQTVYALTVPPWTLVSRCRACNPKCSPVLTYVTVCTFAGPLTILNIPLSHIHA